MSFGTDGFRQSLTLLRISAERFGIADFRAYSVDHPVLDRLRRQYPTIMAAARGAGYWLWKPHIIADTLAAVPDGTVVVYTDAAVVYGRDPSPLLDLADRTPILAFRNRVRDAWQRRYTKRDCFVLLDADRPEQWNRHQLDACGIVFRAGDQSRSLVAEWAAACGDERTLTDLPNRCGLPNFDDFVAHRHDQSILTIIAAKYGLPVLPPAKWTPRSRFAGSEFFYQHRQKTPLDAIAFAARLDALHRGSWPT